MSLARILATAKDSTLRNGKEAVRFAETACTLTGQGNPLFLDTLACAYAEDARFDDAVRTAEKAIETSRTTPSGAFTDSLRGHLDLFRKRIPLAASLRGNAIPTRQPVRDR